MYIDPTNRTNTGLTSWTAITDVGFNIQALAFVLLGEETALGVLNLSEDAIKIYPIPSSGDLYLKTLNQTSIESVRITDMLGKSHEVKYLDGKLDISHLPSGTYALEIKLDNKIIQKKIIKN